MTFPLYNLVQVNENTKEKVFITKSPASHKECMRLKGTLQPEEGVRVYLEPAPKSVKEH